jgi:FkbM family methyltransferase
MSILDGINWYYRFSGARGVIAVSLSRIFGWPRILKIVPPDSTAPVFLRLNTSDICAYRDVLVIQDKPYLPLEQDFRPDTIVDVGAHIGMSALLFAKKYPGAKIIAIEPEPSNFAALVKNTSAYPSILPVHAALWNKPGHVFLGKSAAHPKGAYQIVESGGIEVPAITMEMLMRETGITSIGLLKMDIEGAEKQVFQQCEWLKDVCVLTIELHDRIVPGCRSAVEYAADGFRSYDLGKVTFFVRESRPHKHSQPHEVATSSARRSS